MSKLKRLERKFVNEYVKHKNSVRAVRDTNIHAISDISVRQIARKNLSNPTVRQAVDELLDELFLVEKHRELLDQKMVIVQYDPKTGQVIEEVTDIPDADIALKALDMAYKLKGMYAPEKRQTVTLNLGNGDLDPDIVEMTKKYEDDLRNLYINKKQNGQNTNNSDEDAG